MSVSMKKFILALISYAVFASTVLAGGYGYQQQYSNGYYDQYGYWHYYQTYQPVANVLVVGVPINTIGVPYYYSVGDDIREERLVKKIGDKVRDDIRKETPPPEPAKPVEQEVGLNPGDFKLLVKVGNPSQTPLTVRETENDRRVLSLFKTSCIQCHKPGSAKPGIQLFAADGKLFKVNDLKIERERRMAVYEAVRDGTMPKGKGKSLDPKQIQLVREWTLEV